MDSQHAEGMEGWRLLPMKEIISTKTRRGLLPVGRTKFLDLVERGLIPVGRSILGRTKFWMLEDIKKIGDSIINS